MAANITNPSQVGSIFSLWMKHTITYEIILSKIWIQSDKILDETVSVKDILKHRKGTA